MIKPTFQVMIASPVHVFALGFGSGLAPFAPGTWGSLLGVIIFCALQSLLGLSVWFVVAIISFFAGIKICGDSAELLGVHDHGAIVWDEFVGQWLVLIAVFSLPMSAPFDGYVVQVLLAFVLFRLFDIVKPWPVKAADQRLSGGFGIMFDDVLAAVYAVLVLAALSCWW